MKLPLLSLVGLLFLFCHSSSARIGDTSSSLDRRITADRFAVELRGDGARQLISRGPLRRFLDLAEELESSFDYKVYIKSANGDRLTTTDAKGLTVEDGWTYTAMFLKGVVVAESYERKSGNGAARLNPHEKKGLLIINQGTGSWQELVDGKNADGEIVEGMARYQYLRDDKKVFALFERNHAIFIRKELDERLRERRSINNAAIDEQNRSALQLSISGF